MSNKKAVLLMSYGTPYEISDIMGLLHQYSQPSRATKAIV